MAVLTESFSTLAPKRTPPATTRTPRPIWQQQQPDPSIHASRRVSVPPCLPSVPRPPLILAPTVVSATATATATTTSVVSVTETVAGSVVTISGERVTLTATIASVTRTETLTVTTPYFATLTFTSVNSTVLVTELRSTTYTTVRTLIDPAATLVRNVTLIDAGSTRTLIDAGATRTVIETFTRDGTIVTRTVTGVSQGTGPVAECYDEGCTLSLRYGALRLPAATPAGAVCRIKTESWVYGATTLLP